MVDERRIGKFEKVTISVDGPDVLLQVPKNPCRAHWTDFYQIKQGLERAILQAQQWERDNPESSRSLFI